MLLVLAFALPQIWWAWWWPKYESSFGLQVSGEAVAGGIKLVLDGEIMPWLHLYAAELDSRAVLLYFSNAYAYPVHRSMFEDQSSWERFVGMVRSNVRKVKDRTQ